MLLLGVRLGMLRELVSCLELGRVMVLASIALAPALRPLSLMMLVMVMPLSISAVATLALIMPVLIMPMMPVIMMVMPILRAFVAIRPPLCS